MTAVILTAAVTPSVTDHLVVADPDVRRRQYRASIERWAEAAQDHNFSLAVVETSGASERSLTEGLRARPSILFRSYTPSDDEVRRGKGAIEMAALLSVVADNPWDPEEAVYKCTGRLFVSNAARVVAPLPDSSLRARMTLNRSWIDTRLLGASPSVWRDVIGPAGREVDDNDERPIERQLGIHTSPRLAAGTLTWSRFPERPFFEGVSGTSGQAYSGVRSRLSNVVLSRLEDQLVRLAARKQA
jgi:hypothetical protein